MLAWDVSPRAVALAAAAATAGLLGSASPPATAIEPRLRTVEATDIAEEPVLDFAEVQIRGNLDIAQGLTTLTAENVVFEGRVSITSLERRPKLTFSHVTFRESVDFYLSEFESIACFDCRFEADANFHSVRANSLELLGSTFDGHAIFVAINVEHLNLADVHFTSPRGAIRTGGRRTYWNRQTVSVRALTVHSGSGCS